ncbi:MAG: glycosyltransferase family 39 protein [candidate division WOR-3 bacterium]
MKTKELVLVFIVAAIFRFTVVAPAFFDSTRPLGPPHLDTHEYYALSQSLSHGVYRIGNTDWVLRPPGYPAFLALNWLVFGPDPRSAVLLQVLLGGVMAVVVAIWACRLAGRREALASGILAGLAPVTGLFSGFLLTEALFTTSIALGLLFFRRAPALSGFILGLSALIRPMGIYIACALALFHLIRKDWAKAGFLTLSFLLPVLPWLARNKLIHGKALISTQHEATVFLYAAPYTMMEERGIGYEEALSALRDTLGCDDLWAAALDPELAGEVSKRGIGYILRHPKAYALAHLKGFVRCFYGLGRDFTRMLWKNDPAVLIIVSWGWFYALATYILALLGFLRLREKGLLLAVVVFLLVFLPGPDGSFRFRSPAEPILAVAAGVGLVSLVNRLSRPA